MSKKHVCCVVPSGVTWTAYFANCFTACVAHLLKQPLPGAASQAISWTNPIGSDLVEQRTLGARQALERGATHVMWFDSDMTFQPDVIHRLMAHGRPVVAGNYVDKTRAGRPVAELGDEPEGNSASRTSSLSRSGLESVRRVGMGCMLVEADVFARIEFPWFGHRWTWTDGGAEPCRHVEDAETFPWSAWNGRFEDWWFCDRLAQAGIPIFIDHDVSRQLGHVGGCLFRHGGWDACEPVR